MNETVGAIHLRSRENARRFRRPPFRGADNLEDEIH